MERAWRVSEGLHVLRIKEDRENKETGYKRRVGVEENRTSWMKVMNEKVLKVKKDGEVKRSRERLSDYMGGQ